MDFTKLTNYIDSLEAVYGVPAADCKIMREHQVVYRHAAGHSDYEKTAPVSEGDLYRMFSATKVVTMTAVLQLMEQGKLDLYDEVRKFLPEFTNLRVADHFYAGKFPPRWPGETEPCHLAHNTIRIIDLMTMTAGLSYDDGAKPLMRLMEESGGQAGTKEVAAAMAKLPLVHEPRTRWFYGMCHDVLGAVVEAASGMKFGLYLKAHIFEPLEIRDFYFRLTEGQNRSLSALYQAEIGTRAIHPIRSDQMKSFSLFGQNYESGGGGLIGTVDAYSTFLDALCNGGIGFNGNRILSEESVRLFSVNYITGQMLEDFHERSMGKKEGYGYGLGVRVLMDERTSRSPVGEFGWDGAAGAYVLADPIHHVSIFYVQHIMGFPTVYEEIHPTIRDLAYEALGL